MKRLIWFGLLFFSLGWSFLLPFFYPVDYTLGIASMVVGLLFMLAGAKDFSPIVKRFDKRYTILLIPLVISLFFIGFPFNIGIVILVAAIALYALFDRLRVKHVFIPLGLILSGIVLSVQAALIPFYEMVASRYHDCSAISPLMAGLINLFGLRSSVSSGTVFVYTPDNVYPFTVTTGKLGLFFWLLIFAGAVLFFLLSDRKKESAKSLTVFLAISLVYLVLRFITLVFVYTEVESLSIFWAPIPLFVSFIPLILLFMVFIYLPDLTKQSDIFRDFKIKKHMVLAVFTFFIFVFLLVGAMAYHDPGVKKTGRVLIDEYHSEWENTTKAMDTEWYGMLSVYNYYSWADWLDKYYYVDINVNSTLNMSLLKNYDVLILKCPTIQYSDEEVSAIVQFVKDGGGLYLIGDHTNVFGMNSFLNQVSERFGIRFNYDATYQVPTGWFSRYKPPSMLAHPIVQHVKRFDFLTSCTLSAPLTAEDVITGYNLFSETGTYSTEFFFRSMKDIPDEEAGVFLQTVALEYGKGRVVAFTDSTVFSNYAMFMDGYPNFTLGTIEYLNRENLLPYLNAVFGVFALGAAVLSVYLLRREKSFRVLFTFVVIGALSFSIAVPAFTALNEFYYPLPQPHTDFPRICFVSGYSDFNIEPQPAISPPPYSKQFDTFFIWTQRVGYVPSVEETLRDAVDKGDVVVIINPVKTFSLEDKKLVSRYLEKGGNLILMDSIINQDSTSNQLLGFLYGNTFKLQVMKDMHTLEVGNSTGEQGHLIAGPYLAIVGSGFTYSVLNDDNHTAVAVKDYGEGRVIVVVDSYSFSNAMMGGSFTVPDKTQRAIYETEYYILENLVGGKSYTPLNIS